MGTVGTITDPIIKIKPSRVLENFICNIQQDVLVEAPPGIKNFTEDDGQVPKLSISDVQWLHHYIQQTQPSCYLHELMKGSEIVLPEPEVIPRNPILEERIQWLKHQQSNREYNAMTRNVLGSKRFHPDDSIAYQIKMINRQLIAVAQFIFSVAAGFVFGLFGIELIVGDLDFGFRLLLGIMFALIIALAEIYFLAKKLSEDYIEPQKMHQD